MQRLLPTTDTGRHGVFTSGEAQRAGWTRSALSHAVARGRLVRLQSGMYVPSSMWAGDGPDAERNRLASRVVAAALAIDPAVPSHASAAVLASLPVWELPPRPCVTVPPRYTGDASHAHLHRARLDTGHVLVTGAVARTTTSRTVLDIAREHSVEDAVVAGDAALARGMTDGERLMCCAEFCQGWPGSRRMRAALSMLDARAESPLESVSRLRMSWRGVPPPDLQTEILTLDGLWLGRIDFYWDEFGVAGEVDGRSKYRALGEEVIWREKRRQEQMEDTGLVFVRWGRPDLEDMHRLQCRLGSAFTRGARLARADRRWLARPAGRLVPPIHAAAAS